MSLWQSPPITAELASTWWQYLVLFLVVGASWAGVPLVGATAAGAAGVAASQGRLDLATTIVVITIAGEAGGLIGYHIGFRWVRRLVERPGRHQAYREKVLMRGEQAYERWGRLAVFFTPSIVSGTAKMRFGQFVVWNLVDALGFALFTVGAAYGIGRLLTGHEGSKDFAVFILFGIGLVLLTVVRRHHEEWRKRRQRD